jgi:hypothetical protein
MRTLKDINANKLFILDDIGPGKRGAYYLGKNKDLYFANLVEKLISQITSLTNIKTKIFLGSSKGGYASLFFGLKCKADVIISGAQQYYIGNYLYNKENKNIYEYLTGDSTQESIHFLNNLLLEEISKREHFPQIYLHYSDNEHTYKEHIVYLMDDLKKNGYKFTSDVKHYKEHSDVSKYFPTYMLKLINTIMKNNLLKGNEK